ncbi:hypothetical protein [Nonomuraea sp. 10N515B]|uniref:hypothetical protein n=1 Tax=Nonomuraea sp. 10N515B TaxID=3457422 RepID=UPI003FCE28FF
MADLPNYVWALVLLGVVGIPAVTCVMLYRGAVAAGVGTRAATGIAGGALALIGGWLVVSALIANAGIYHQQPGQVRPWLAMAFAGILTVLLLGTRIPVVARVLAEPDTLARLALPHTLRVAGVVFLVVMALGKLPAVFALPAALGDIAVGLAAPLVARRLYRGVGHRRAVWFHVLGIVDLVVAVTIGFLAGLGSLRPLDVTPTTEALSLLPLALVATGAVPMAIALHIVSLRRLRAIRSLPRQDGHLLPMAG